MSKLPEPFGYFKHDPFGWTDCAETDDGAIPLYDQSAMEGMADIATLEQESRQMRARMERLQSERDELLAGLKSLAHKCDELCRLDRRFDDVLDVADKLIESVELGVS